MIGTILGSRPIKVLAATPANVISKWGKEFRHERSILVVGGPASPHPAVLPAIARHMRSTWSFGCAWKLKLI
jgi:hypothetical protein